MLKSAKAKGIFSKNVLYAILYGACSTSMAFINKAVVSTYHFNFPFLIMSCQMMMSIAVIELCQSLHYVKITKFSLSLGFSLFWASLFSAAHSITALYALSGMSIPMYAAIKRCTPLVTLFLSTLVLKKQFPGFDVVISVILITAGCVIAGVGDLQFDLGSYLYGTVSVIIQGLYLTFIQKSSESMHALQMLYVNSCNVLPVFFILCIIFEASGVIAFQNFYDIGFLLCFIAQVSVGVLLNFSLFLCTIENSALTTSIVGVMKSILQTIVGSFTFGGIIFNTLSSLGIVLNTFGGIMYAFVKYRKGVETMSISKTTHTNLV